MAKFVVYKDHKAEFRWRFKANNGQIIADSGEGYANKNDCVYGINFVKQHSPATPTEDLT